MSCIEVNFVDLSCLEQAKSLYTAYINMLTGKQRVRVQYGNDYVEYAPKSQQDMEALRNLYMTIWNDCDQAREVLPPIHSSSVRRGPPVFGQIGRGRL